MRTPWDSMSGFNERRIVGSLKLFERGTAGCGNRSTLPRAATLRESFSESRKMRNGAPGEIRTPGLFLRREALYPAELRARNASVHGLHCVINSGLLAHPGQQKMRERLGKNPNRSRPGFPNFSPRTLRQIRASARSRRKLTYQAVSSAVQEQTPWPLPNRIKNWHSVSRSLASRVV
jgi:hypothetical protein